jgi:hypothetical protein
VLHEAFPDGRRDEDGPKVITSRVNQKQDIYDSLKTFFQAGR